MKKKSRGKLLDGVKTEISTELEFSGLLLECAFFNIFFLQSTFMKGRYDFNPIQHSLRPCTSYTVCPTNGPRVSALESREI